jgi:type IV pilus assembly protein PilO
MLQSRSSRWVAATAVACAFLLIAAWFLLMAPRRAEASELVAQQATAEQNNQQLESAIAQLKEQAKALPARQAELSALQEQLPTSVNMPRLVRDLDSFALSAGVTLTEVSPGEVTAVDAAGAAAGGTAAGGAAATSGASAGVAAAGTAAGGSPGVGAGSGMDAAATATSNQLYVVPVRLTLSGDYFATAVFLKKIQNEMKRALLITQVDLSSDAKSTDGSVSMAIQGQVYVFQQAGGRVASIAPQETVPTSGASSGVSGTSIPGASAVEKAEKTAAGSIAASSAAGEVTAAEPGTTTGATPQPTADSSTSGNNVGTL